MPDTVPDEGLPTAAESRPVLPGPGEACAPQRPAPGLVAGLARSVSGDGWELEVSPLVANGGRSLYGGAALAASVEVAAAETGWPVRWASARFLLAPVLGERVSFTCTIDARGRHTCHATVRATTDQGLAFETGVVTGDGDQRAEAVSGQWASPPPVAAPEDCEAMPTPGGGTSLAAGRSERRPAYGFDSDLGDGHRAAWIRLRDGGTGTPAGLAWIADCVVMGLRGAFTLLTRATSLDNAIRYAAPGNSEWVLADARLTGASDGYAYGVVHLFDRGGTLLATASQTCLVRLDGGKQTLESPRR